MKVAVTGANGFVGREVVKRLAEKGHETRAICRSHGANADQTTAATETVFCGDLRSDPLPPLIEGCDGVVNCAARVHVTEREGVDSRPLYDAMNVDLPCRLAEAARSVGARRFVQISSVAAFGPPGDAAIVTDATPPRPVTLYGKSKHAADERLGAMSDRELSIVSLRPPAVYGPGVGAWFAKLATAARSGMPLPLAAMTNARSFIHVRNLADAVVAALNSEETGAFIVTDGPPVPVSQLYGDMLAFYGKPDLRWPLPPALVRLLARIALGARAESLTEDARYDGSRFADTFGFAPSVAYPEGLSETLTSL